MAETTNLFAGTATFNAGFGQTPFGTYDNQGTYNSDVENTAFGLIVLINFSKSLIKTSSLLYLK